MKNLFILIVFCITTNIFAGDKKTQEKFISCKKQLEDAKEQLFSFSDVIEDVEQFIYLEMDPKEATINDLSTCQSQLAEMNGHLVAQKVIDRLKFGSEKKSFEVSETTRTATDHSSGSVRTQ